MEAPGSIVVLVIKPSSDARVGINLGQPHEGEVIITALPPDSLFSGTLLKVGMRVDAINGTKCNTPKEYADLMKAAEKEVQIAASEIPLFKKLVTEEFGREFNITWWVKNSNKCTISHKNNPDEFTACCCPGCVQQYVFTLTLNDEGRVDVVDTLHGSFNRVQGNMAAGQGNSSQAIAVVNMTANVNQKASRVETRLMMNENNSSIPVVTAIPAPQAEVMVRDENSGKKSMADEIAKLKALLDDGVLTEEEFQTAKQKVIDQ